MPNTKTKKFPRRSKPDNYRRLLSIESDAKTVKGLKQGYLTGIMYLAPHTSSGVANVCARASKGCIAGCLNTAGRAKLFPWIQTARIAKTRFMVENRRAFMDSLAYDVETLRRRAIKRGLKPACRVNGTSDLPKLAHAMARMFPDVEFYDYTKLPGPWKRTLPNYSLTFSHSEVNASHCMESLSNDVNVAVVFASKSLPATWNGFPVVSGDESDLRFKDRQGVVVGLSAKGKAKQDCSGFVVRPELIQISL